MRSMFYILIACVRVSVCVCKSVAAIGAAAALDVGIGRQSGGRPHTTYVRVHLAQQPLIMEQKKEQE